jgi:hypothetical protein
MTATVTVQAADKAVEVRHLTPGDDVIMIRKAATVIVSPGDTKIFHIWDTRDLHITEVQDKEND